MAFDPTQPFEVVEDPQAQAGGAPRFDPSQAFEVVDDGQTGLIEGGLNAARRGLALSRLASEMEQPEPDPTKIIEIQREIAQNPPSAEFQMVMDDNATPQQSWSAFTSNPVGVVNELMIDSLASYASQMVEKAPARVAIGAGSGVAIGSAAFGIGAIPAGATGALAGFAQSGGAASYSLEMAGGILESLEQAGVNMASPEELGAALQDGQRMQVAREFAQKKAIPVAAFDTVSALIAGRVMGAKPATVLAKLGKGMVETAVQSVLGMGGEAAGQISQSGEITSVRQVGAEGLGEIAPSMIEVGVGTGVQALQGQQPAAAPATAPAAAAPQPAPFTPPPAAETVVVEEVFGDATTAAAEPVAAAPAFDPSQDFEVVQEPSETIVTEPAAAPTFQFDLADDTATAPEMDAEADVFSGLQRQQPSGPPAAPKIFRGVSPDVDYSSGDQFWSESREVAENYAAQTGTEGTIDEATPETLPKNLYTTTDKPTLKDELKLKNEPFAPEFDAEAKTVLQARGFEGIRYESGTDLGGEQAAEFHVFGKAKQKQSSSSTKRGKRSGPATASPAINLSEDQAAALASVAAGTMDPAILTQDARDAIAPFVPILPKQAAQDIVALPFSGRGKRVLSYLAEQPAAQPAAATSSFAQAFRAAKKTEDKRLAVFKAVADGSIVASVIEAAESGKPLPSLEKFKDAFPYEGPALPSRVDLSKVAIKPIKPAAPDVAARSHTAKDSSRFVLEGVYYDAEAQAVVATDGRRMFVMPQKVEGESRIIAVADGRQIQGQFPNWKYVVPATDKDTVLFTVDVEKARRAGTVLSGINKSLKSIAQPAKIQIGMATLDPSYVKDAVEAIVASGAKKIYAASKDDQSPVMLRGDNGAMAVIMPMRGMQNDLVVDASTVIGEVIGNEGREVRAMFEAGNPNTPAKKSRARIKKMTAQSGAIDLSIVEDLVEYGKTIYRAGMSFGKWASQMVKEFGQGIASFLKQAFDRIVQAYKDSPYSDTTGAVGDVRPKAKPRQFEQKAKKSDAITEEAKAELGSEYVPITLEGTADQAKAWINENGLDAAEQRILDLSTDELTPTPVDFAIGLEMAARLGAMGEHQRQARVVRIMSRRATSIGQTISVLAMMSRLTPEGIVFYANQIIEQHIDSLPEERQQQIRAAQDSVVSAETEVKATRKTVAEDTIINGTQGGEKVQEKLKRRIKDKTQKQRTNVGIRSVLTSKATKAEATKQITQLLTENGISESEAGTLAMAITSRFYKVMDEARKSIATQRKPKEPKLLKIWSKLVARLNGDGITDEDFVAGLSLMAKLPTMTPELGAKLKDLTRQLNEAKGDQDMQLVLAGRIFEEIHSLVPVDFWVKVRAFSYLMMLFSPKTWIRNIGGNVIQFVANAGADTAMNIAGGRGSIFSAGKTGDRVKSGRLKSLLTPIWDVQKGMEWNARQNPQATFGQNLAAGIDHLRLLSKLTTQNKFEVADAKEVGRRIFSSKFMGMLETSLSIALGGPDRAFWKSALDASLSNREARARQMGEWTGRHTPEDVDGAFADAAEAIYQNANTISKTAAKWRSSLNYGSTKLLTYFLPGVKPTEQFGFGTALMAFTQVPGAIARTAINWSPLGLITNLSQAMNGILWKASNQRAGKPFNQQEFAKAFTKALGGTGIYVAGYYLYAMGVITASQEDDDDVEAMRRASGMGQYRINATALKRLLGSMAWGTPQKPEDGDLILSYDWAQPLAITFAAGAELAKMVEQNDRNGVKKGLAAKAAMPAISLAAGAKSLLELPLLSGLSSFIDQIDTRRPDTIVGAVSRTVLGIPSMFVPQLVRQANQLFFDNNTRETRGVNASSAIPVTVQRAFNQIAANTPGVGDQFPPRMDIMGVAQERYQYASNHWFNVLINPALTSRVKTNPALQEVERLMQATGETSQFPRAVSRMADVNGKKIDLTNEQISAYQYYLGNYTMSMFNWRMASPRYARLPDTEKVRLLSQDLEDVNAATKSALFGHDVNRLTRRQRVMRANLVNSPLGQSMPPR